MRYVIISSWLFFTLLVYGCDPLYGCFVSNKTNDTIYVQLKPPGQTISYRDSSGYRYIGAARRMSLVDSIATYQVPSNVSLMFYNDLGYKPHVSTFPYEYMEVIHHSGRDTLRLSNKEAILRAFKPYKRIRKFDISIEN
jgi:hypothetical protein